MTDKLDTDVRFSIIPEWLLDMDVSDKAIRLYAVLARYADNDTQNAFPGRTLLARRLKCSLKSIDRAAEELITQGAVSRKQRVKDGKYQSSIYTVHRTGPRVTHDATPRHTRRDPVSPVTNRTRTTELELPNDIFRHFEDFWNAYPRKLGKGEARQAFARAVNLYGHDVVVDGAKRFASDPNLPAKQFIPRPATWINQERWNDEPYPVKDVKPWERPAEGPGRRDWVKALHDDGEHWECREGEFGCK